MTLSLLWKTFVGSAPREGVPEARPSASLLAKIVIDEALLRVMSGSSGFWAHPGRLDQTVLNEVSRGTAFYDKHGWLEDPASYHREPPELRDPHLHSVLGLIPHEHLSFESEYLPEVGEPGRIRWLAYRENSRAHAWVMRHFEHDRPWIIMLHGYGMGTPLADLGGMRARYLHSRLGLNVLSYVMPLHGLRRVGSGYGSELFTGGVANLIHGEAQAMWDLRRLISWIRGSQGADRIAVHGLSLGGYTTALLAALEPGLACAIAGIPASDFVELFRTHTAVPDAADTKRMDRFWEDTKRLLTVVSPLAMAPRISHDRRYIFAGVADRLAPPGAAQALWEHWERPRILWYQGTHTSFLVEPEVRDLFDEAMVD
jgi:pimeloyl-ACP methyl ester carboxylesterase